MKNKLSKVFALAVVLAVGLWGGGALATELVYTPVNPNFGGNPLNGSYLLNNAQAQNNQKDPAAVEEEKGNFGQFGDSLCQRILSTISQRITYDMFGDKRLLTGSYMIGDFQLNVEENLGNVVIRHKDNITSEQTEMLTPQFLGEAAKKIKQKIILIYLAFLLLFFTGCFAPVQEFATQAPTLTQVPYTHEQLRTLPLPKGKIPVSLYSFRDQTGQYKPLPGVSSFSTAVTQGATSMLIQALKDSGWFVAVEREGLQDLLTERKIIRAALKENGKASKSTVKLPPLEYGHILLEGGITSYETNIVTGGLGARYWGLGGSVEYRQDRVSVHLRAVDIRSGRILKSVSTTKTILSKKVDASLFRFLSFKRLWEIEGGFTTNEPTQLCVAAAIDKAVIALIVEGVVDGLWTLKDPNQMKNQVIQDYLVEAGRSKEKPSIPADRIKG